MGKGRGRRVLAHLTEERSSQKRERIDELSAAGLAPRLEVLAHGLQNEETALRIEFLNRVNEAQVAFLD